MNTTTTVRPLAPTPVALRARDVADLTTSSGYPWVPVLLSTEPLAPLAAIQITCDGVIEGRGAWRDLAPDPAGRRGRHEQR